MKNKTLRAIATLVVTMRRKMLEKFSIRNLQERQLVLMVLVALVGILIGFLILQKFDISSCRFPYLKFCKSNLDCFLGTKCNLGQGILCCPCSKFSKHKTYCVNGQCIIEMKGSKIQPLL